MSETTDTTASPTTMRLMNIARNYNSLKVELGESVADQTALAKFYDALEPIRDALTEAREDLARLGAEQASAFEHGSSFHAAEAEREVSKIHAKIDAALALLAPSPREAETPGEGNSAR